MDFDALGFKFEYGALRKDLGGANLVAKYDGTKKGYVFTLQTHLSASFVCNDPTVEMVNGMIDKSKLKIIELIKT